MSKISDLRYYMQNLVGEIENIEDEEIRNNVQKAFDKVEEAVDEIEGGFNDVQYTVNNILG